MWAIPIKSKFFSIDSREIEHGRLNSHGPKNHSHFHLSLHIETRELAFQQSLV